MLSPYFKNYAIALQENLNYKADFLVRLLTGFFEIYAKVAIWYTIVTVNRSMLSDGIVSDTIKYMILASIISLVFMSFPESEITDRIRSGEIVRDLIYPVSLPVVLFFRSLGNITVVFLTRAIPSFFVLSIIYRPQWDFSIAKISVFSLSVFIGLYLYFLLNLLTDMISFWIIEYFTVSTIRNALFSVLSGSLAPLWFYPKWFLKIIDFLPFRIMIYSPLEFYFDKVPADQVLSRILISILWMLFMTGLVFVVWRTGLKRVEIQGG